MDCPVGQWGMPVLCALFINFPCSSLFFSLIQQVGLVSGPQGAQGQAQELFAGSMACSASVLSGFVFETLLQAVGLLKHQQPKEIASC